MSQRQKRIEKVIEIKSAQRKANDPRRAQLVQKINGLNKKLSLFSRKGQALIIHVAEYADLIKKAKYNKLDAQRRLNGRYFLTPAEKGELAGVIEASDNAIQEYEREIANNRKEQEAVYDKIGDLREQIAALTNQLNRLEPGM